METTFQKYERIGRLLRHKIYDGATWEEIKDWLDLEQVSGRIMAIALEKYKRNSPIHNKAAS